MNLGMKELQRRDKMTQMSAFGVVQYSVVTTHAKPEQHGFPERHSKRVVLHLTGHTKHTKCKRILPDFFYLC